MYVLDHLLDAMVSQSQQPRIVVNTQSDVTTIYNTQYTVIWGNRLDGGVELVKECLV